MFMLKSNLILVCGKFAQTFGDFIRANRLYFRLKNYRPLFLYLKLYSIDNLLYIKIKHNNYHFAGEAICTKSSKMGTICLKYSLVGLIFAFLEKFLHPFLDPAFSYGFFEQNITKYPFEFFNSRRFFNPTA